MTNLDSLLKSRDITLPTKVRLVKAMVFPVVMYGCESWTVMIKLMTGDFQAADWCLSRSCIGAFQSAEWAVVKQLTGTNQAADRC